MIPLTDPAYRLQVHRIPEVVVANNIALLRCPRQPIKFDGFLVWERKKKLSELCHIPNKKKSFQLMPLLQFSKVSAECFSLANRLGKKGAIWKLAKVDIENEERIAKRKIGWELYK